MAYAHQGIELKQHPGPRRPAGDHGARKRGRGSQRTAPPSGAKRPSALTKRGTDVLMRVER